MATRRRLTRSDLILAGFVLAVLFLFFVAARTPYLELVSSSQSSRSCF